MTEVQITQENVEVWQDARSSQISMFQENAEVWQEQRDKNVDITQENAEVWWVQRSQASQVDIKQEVVEVWWRTLPQETGTSANTIAHVFTGGESAVFIQPNGNGTEVEFLGCHSIEGIDEPLGDLVTTYCVDISKNKRWLSVSESTSPDGFGSLVITEDVTDVLSVLTEIECPFTLYVNFTTCGRRDIFANSDKTFIINVRKITGRTINNLVMLDNDARTQQEFTLAIVLPVVEVRQVATGIADTNEANEFNKIVAVVKNTCYNCSVNANIIYAVTNSNVAAARIWYSTNGGNAWNFVSGPFAIGENILAATVFETKSATNRLLVARSSNGIDNIEVAYTDDNGATWNNVEVAPYIGGAIGVNALYNINKYDIWFAASGGKVYHSNDGGLTWSVSHNSVITNQNLRAIHKVDKTIYTVGNAGIVLKSVDNGITWEACTTVAGTPNLTCVQIVGNAVFVGTVTGIIYASTDGGITWENKNNDYDSVNDLQFFNEQVGFASVFDTSTFMSKLLRTRDGGYTWETIPTPNNDILNSIVTIDANNAFASGMGIIKGRVVRISG